MAPSKVLLPVALLCLLCVPVTSSSNSSCAADTTSTYNASATYLGCYLDRSVSILSASKLSTIAMTPQFCVDWCGERGYTYGGIEFGTYVASILHVHVARSGLMLVIDNAFVTLSPISARQPRQTIPPAVRNASLSLQVHAVEDMCKTDRQ